MFAALCMLTMSASIVLALQPTEADAQAQPVPASYGDLRAAAGEN
jgi:hypothetical protein